MISMSLLALVSAAMPIWLLLHGRLRFVQDFFALFLYCEFLVYLNIAPVLWAPLVSPELQWIHIQLQLACTVLFEAPFWAVYLAMRRHGAAAEDGGAAPTRLRSRQQSWLAVLGLALALAFLVIGITNHAFFTRTGYDSYAQTLLSLTPLEFLLLRIFQLNGSLLVAVLAGSLCLVQSRA
ncbi:MAG: hypothetical protein ACYC6M_09885, partial [Terriglobales bacterium]